MKESKESKSVEKRCSCPYCDEEITLSVLPYCKPCGVTLRYCPSCQIAVPREAETCPQCGGKLEEK
ncbi:MAG: zinc ribbon domain-containing protein [Deltaproteobacteria bacterium]|nr:zinc ribbon domain-containing protein [Deltaproteobacteria bacterium]